MKLTSQNVNSVFMDCLFRDQEPTEPRVIGLGVLHDFGFHPERLAGHESEIIELLEQLPEQFQQKGGGGWTFLNACMDRDGEQWADDHATMQQLLALGSAIERVRFLFPRRDWSHLPGGMPYFVVWSEKLKEHARA